MVWVPNPELRSQGKAAAAGWRNNDAEIAIVNRHAIALAADSAVTIGRNRVWKSATKIVALSPRNDIVAMVYNAADFLGIPWEALIKRFRDDFCKSKFKTVSACSSAFFDFLQKDIIPSVPNLERLEKNFFIAIIEDIANIAKLHDYSIYTAATKFLSYVKDAAKQCNAIQINQSFSDFKIQYENVIRDLCKTVLGSRPHKKTSDLIVEGAYLFFSHELSSHVNTGIVFAGFGHDELLPSLHHYDVDGTINGILRCWNLRIKDLNTEVIPNPAVLAFAQDDMIALFMNGIYTEHIQFLSGSLLEVLNQKSDEIINAYVVDKNDRLIETKRQSAENRKIVRKLQDRFALHRRKIFTQPVMESITNLPKDEMAAMAEALVELTSLRRRMSDNIESVGGPTDVVVISKSDGVIWMKRKHYFNVDINGDYVQRKRQIAERLSK